MKKIILLMVMVFSLSAGELMCDDAYERFIKYDEQFNLAWERKDLRAANIASSLRVFYIEKTITSCGIDWEHREQTLIVRDGKIDVDNSFKAYLDGK